MVQKIVIDARPAAPFSRDETNALCKNILQCWLNDHPEYDFILITDRDDFDTAFANTRLAIIRRPLTGFKKWGDKIFLSRVLKKNQASIFFSFNSIIPGAGKTAQYVFINNTGSLHKKNSWPVGVAGKQKRGLSRLKTTASLVFAGSQEAKKILITYYKIKEANIKVIYPGYGSEPVQPGIQQEFLREHGLGNPYFLYGGDIHPAHNLLNLCKAFSFFKKRQQSHWKLVIAGETIKGAKPFLDKLDHYKYREDLVMITPIMPEEMQILEKNAYARIFPSLIDYNSASVIRSLGDGVPVVATKNTVVEEIAGAALIAGASDHQDMADKMMLLYKDENLHRQLAVKGKEIVHSFTWKKMADELWTAMTERG